MDGVHLRVHEVAEPILTRKTSKRAIEVPVPQTDTRGRGEKPKALGRMPAKELGKIAP